MLNFFSVLARGADCTNVHLSRLIAGVKRAGLGVHDISLAMGSADVLGNEVSRVNVSCTGTAKRIARIRSVVSSRRIGGRAMELVNDHESFLSLSSRGALSILDASFECVRASYLVSGEPRSTVRIEQRAFGGIRCLIRSGWSLRWLDVCMCTDVLEGLRVRGS